MDLRAKLIQTPPYGVFVSIPVEQALSQLAFGSVKTSFGELRAALPRFFDSSAENDARQIALPLNEIISRINPALLTRRAAKTVEVADGIVGPFATHTPVAGPTKAQTPFKPAPMMPPKAPEPVSAPATPTPATPPPAVAPKTMASAPKPAPIFSRPRQFAPAPAAPAAVIPPAPIPFSSAAARAAAGPGDLQLPLSAVITVLPMDLCEKLIQTPPTDAFFSIPMEKALWQLAHGSVKISFGELRATLPGLFDNSSENDARQIVLPLNEIVSRINPALLARRAGKKIEVADNIPGPFGTCTPNVGSTPAQAPVKAAPMPPPKAPDQRPLRRLQRPSRRLRQLPRKPWQPRPSPRQLLQPPPRPPPLFHARQSNLLFQRRRRSPRPRTRRRRFHCRAENSVSRVCASSNSGSRACAGSARLPHLHQLQFRFPRRQFPLQIPSSRHCPRWRKNGRTPSRRNCSRQT